MVFHRGRALDQLVRKALVISLTVVMLDVLRDRPAEMTFAERDHSAETLFLDRAHEALRVRIRVGCLERRLHHADPRLGQPCATATGLTERWPSRRPTQHVPRSRRRRRGARLES